MPHAFSGDRLRFLLNRFRERLWVKPLAVCLLSIGAAFVAKLADGVDASHIVPVVAAASVESLLSIMAASMLVIATFSVASMLSAYASAGTTATPRAFSLIVADDASQNALSTFVGAFIFSVVALTAVQNNYFGPAGLFLLFVLTAVVLAIVIMTFVLWVDRIARLGRMGSTIDKVEKVAAAAMKRRRNAPTLHGASVGVQERGRAVLATRVGYVQYIDVAAIQSWAEEAQVHVEVAALPGTFAAPGRPVAYVSNGPVDRSEMDDKGLVDSFQIGGDRLFDDDPRFGLIVLSEIAGRALSPAVNDPGTAIDVIGTLLRLFALWAEPKPVDDEEPPQYDRVAVPEVTLRDMFDDAFTAIARDGAGMVEVSVRLQKALQSLASMGNSEMRDAAEYHARLALGRAELALNMPEDLAAVQDAGMFAKPPGPGPGSGAQGATSADRQ